MNFFPFPVLETKRLLLRQITLNDWEEVYFLRSDKAVNKYVIRPVPKNRKEAEEFIEKITSGIKNNKHLYWSITLKSNPKMIGSISLWNFSEDRKIGEVGYDLHTDFQNQGIMSEAMHCVLAFGFDKLKLNQIEAFTHRENENSKMLLEKHHFILNKERKDKDNGMNSVYELKPYS